jgi:hypothetical protein
MVLIQKAILLINNGWSRTTKVFSPVIPSADYFAGVKIPGFIRREINQGFTKIIKYQ